MAPNSVTENGSSRWREQFWDKTCLSRWRTLDWRIIHIQFGLPFTCIIGILSTTAGSSPGGASLPQLMTTYLDKIEIRASGIHGSGVFARNRVPAGVTLIEYLGERITKAESMLRCEANNRYIFSIDDRHDLDGNFEWNPARLINHSCHPNCEAELDGGRIWIRTLRGVEAGEELSFNYGYDLADYREHPCLCRAKTCVGYMVAEEFFPQLRDMAEALKED